MLVPLFSVYLLAEEINESVLRKIKLARPISGFSDAGIMT
jgi:hypothetical protein